MRKNVLLCFGVLAGACAVRPELVADDNAQRPPDSNPTAWSLEVGVTNIAGATVTVDGSAWRGTPVWLPNQVTPVLVTIENQSGRPLTISADRISLIGRSGVSYRAMPVLPPDPEVAASEVRFTAHDFYVAPYEVQMYPQLAAWPELPFDPAYYERNYSYWPQGLPSRDMVSRAVPDGVLADGGKVSGFVFFPALPKTEKKVQFNVQLMDTERGRPLAEARVPLAVRRPL
jgi:hypothetical protein